MGMDRTTHVALIKRLLRQMDAGTTFLLPGEYRNAVSHYLDPEQFRREREILFRRYPISVGFAGQVRNPGDFFTHGASGVPILVVRDRQGVLRAFLNVCRHRGTMLVRDACGTDKKAFICPYHGWSYGTDGRLLAIVHEQGFSGIEKEQYSLVPLPVAERFGLVWVVPTPGAALDLDRFLGPLAAELDGYGLHAWRPYATKAIHRRMNWKLMYDTFLEFYHFRWAHRDTIFFRFLDNLITFDEFFPHSRLIGAARTLPEVRALPEERWNLAEHAVILYAIFPQTVLASLGDHFNVFAMYPGERIDESVCYLSVMIPDGPLTESARRHWDNNMDLACRTVETEDFEMGEGIQRGLASGANTHMTYGRFEAGLPTFHRAIAHALDLQP
jgi:phenylpropionate dioxygenase-like ring-hydroxylating dioxygenase large terminal subunit